MSHRRSLKLTAHLAPHVPIPVPLVTRPVPLVTRLVPLVTRPVPLVTHLVPLVTRPVPLVTRPVPLVTRPILLVTQRHSVLLFLGVEMVTVSLYYCYDTHNKFFCVCIR